MKKRIKELRQAGGQLVVVSSDAVPFLRPMKQKMKLDFLMLSDDDLKLIERLEVREGKRRNARPATFVLDQEGRVQWRHIGNHPADRPSEDAILRAVRQVVAAQQAQSAPSSR